MRNFSGGKPSDPRFNLLRSQLASAPPPNMNFVPTGLHVFLFLRYNVRTIINLTSHLRISFSNGNGYPVSRFSNYTDFLKPCTKLIKLLLICRKALKCVNCACPNISCIIFSTKQAIVKTDLTRSRIYAQIKQLGYASLICR